MALYNITWGLNTYPFRLFTHMRKELCFVYGIFPGRIPVANFDFFNE
jgi:hypothetical protein